MTIGQLALAAEVNVETVRYYQRRGLVPTPARPLGGQRKYPQEALRRIHFVRRAQTLGFTLDEILTLIECAGDAKATREVAESKLGRLAERIEELKRMRRELTKVMGELAGDRKGVTLVERLHDAEP